MKGRSSDKTAMPSSIAVVIATKGRPQEVSYLLTTLQAQSKKPDMIVISACDPEDFTEFARPGPRVKVILGEPGLPAQRNRALKFLEDLADIIVFFDDDFIPSKFWIERAHQLFSTLSDLVCITGLVLADGQITRAGGIAKVEEADATPRAIDCQNVVVKDFPSPYGCNMALRTNRLRGVTFDERLALYGWLEDHDFGVRLRPNGRIIWTDAVWGVHLATRSGRTSEMKFGYSQVVNPWYLMLKGTMKKSETTRHLFRAFVGNSRGLVLQDKAVDRVGRFKGNVLGLIDIFLCRWAPEKVKNL
jgi:GT2 family glycosyltransferase